MKSKVFITTAILGYVMLFFLASSQVLADEESRGKPNDRIEIEQLLKDYAWGVDHKDTELWMNIWSSDATYDLSNLGFGIYTGTDQLEWFMKYVVFPGEPMCFSLISNIDIKFTGKNTAVGTDYFIHEGYVPVQLKTDGTMKKFNQFNPGTRDLLQALLLVGTNKLTEPLYLYDFVRDHKEGQHKYEFVKKHGKWKISYLKGLPLYSATEVVKEIGGAIPIDQRPNADFYNSWLLDPCSLNPFSCLPLAP